MSYIIDGEETHVGINYSNLKAHNFCNCLLVVYSGNGGNARRRLGRGFQSWRIDEVFRL